MPEVLPSGSDDLGDNPDGTTSPGDGSSAMPDRNGRERNE
ncbi:hypothetical protein SAMN04488129_10725 [Halomonas daqiaonensis]|uniref:Uncharacterized protein n=1 Tax=Halomonas daqiaonensis TaxID=650850 RepID=A0A1H7MN93_9GAMM|nr:hypothetical protein SAMN04488129_10725 [Halomonas daqiaonensis]